MLPPAFCCRNHPLYPFQEMCSINVRLRPLQYQTASVLAHTTKKELEKKIWLMDSTFKDAIEEMPVLGEDRTKALMGMLNWKGFIFQLLQQWIFICFLLKHFWPFNFQGTFMFGSSLCALNSTSPWPTCSSLEPSETSLFHLQCEAVKYRDQAFHHLNMLSVITQGSLGKAGQWV